MKERMVIAAKGQCFVQSDVYFVCVALVLFSLLCLFIATLLLPYAWEQLSIYMAFEEKVLPL